MIKFFFFREAPGLLCNIFLRIPEPSFYKRVGSNNGRIVADLYFTLIMNLPRLFSGFQASKMKDWYWI